MNEVLSGLDVLFSEGFSKLKGARVGLLSNQATVDRKFQHAADLLHQAPEVNLTCLFAPEHGFRGEWQDMDSIDDVFDKDTGLPVISLYGRSEETLSPKVEDLKKLDILLVDLPDIGSRYYTFAQSLGLCMKVASKIGTKIIVLDRPNPIGGSQLEGAALQKSCRSFCGYAPVANRHGLTLGELALLMQKGFGDGKDAVPNIDCDLSIVQLRGWNRKDYFDATGLPWVLPSPNMPTLDTALIYPGSCLFEGTALSEGRGTTKPLELFGAPYVEGKDLAEAALKQGLPLNGVVLRNVSFLPKFQKHANTLCGGVQIHVTDRETFKPFRCCLALIAAARQLYPEKFRWREQTFEFIDNIPAIDLLYGSDKFRLAIEAGNTVDSLLPDIERFEEHYAEARKPFLLY